MARLAALWRRLQESLWFVPTIIVLLAILLGVGMVELSTRVDDEALARWPRIFGAGPGGSRSMLSAIAGSMITVAGVTFSITMLTVTQASTQYTPRILRNFMRDRANQTVLGTFVGIFAYCLVVLRTIREGDDAEFVPSLAVLVGVLLALVGVAVLIFFIHHIATTLQASEIIARISRDTRHVVDRFYPGELSGDAEEADRGNPHAAVAPDRWHPIPAPASGYIQHANLEGLVRIADRCDLLVRLERATGEFVVRGHPLGSFAPHPIGDVDARGGDLDPDEVARAMGRECVIGAYRSLDQDPGFGIRQLVDIALKALSPGINDSTTAVNCIDYLGTILAQLATRRFTVVHHGCDDRRVRLVTTEPGFEELLELAVAEIRQHANGNVSVLTRLIDMLATLARGTPAAARRRAVARQVELVMATAAATVTGPHDLTPLDALARRTLDALNGPAARCASLAPASPRT
jgi:uncharacterized membrane protein